MPRLNSGTERPRAPLLEPYITLVLFYITEVYCFTVIIKSLVKNIKNAYILNCKDASFTGAVAS